MLICPMARRRIVVHVDDTRRWALTRALWEGCGRPRTRTHLRLVLELLLLGGHGYHQAAARGHRHDGGATQCAECAVAQLRCECDRRTTRRSRHGAARALRPTTARKPAPSRIQGIPIAWRHRPQRHATVMRRPISVWCQFRAANCSLCSLSRRPVVCNEPSRSALAWVTPETRGADVRPGGEPHRVARVDVGASCAGHDPNAPSKLLDTSGCRQRGWSVA